MHQRLYRHQAEQQVGEISIFDCFHPLFSCVTHSAEPALSTRICVVFLTLRQT